MTPELIPELSERVNMWLWEEEAPGRRDNRGEDHKAGMALVGSRNDKKPRVTGADE